MAECAEADTSRDLLLALLALRRGLIDQDKLVVAFEAWSDRPGRSMSEILEGLGFLNEGGRVLLEGLVEEHRQRRADRPSGDEPTPIAARPLAETVAYIGSPSLEGALAGRQAASISTNERFQIVRRSRAGGWARSSSRSTRSSIARSR